jgi:asparagine synthetase B (glutamine-hydrolysing)
VDSALVAAALCRLGKRVETFSFFYDRQELNQTHTDTVAEFLGIKHNWFPITAEMIGSGLDSYPLWFNRPTNWANYVIQTASLCRDISRRGFSVCYSGDGCDGVFLGYPRTHSTAVLLNSMIRVPAPVMGLLDKAASLYPIEYTLGRPFRVGMNILRNLSRRPPAKGYIPFRILDDISLRHLRADTAPPQEHDVEEVMRLLSKGLEDLSPERRAYKGKGTVGLNKLKIAASGDVSGVPVVSPYMHPGMAQFARSLPETMLRPPNEPKYAVLGKYLLLKMAEVKGLLPASVIFQKKISAVEGPIDSWYFGVLNEKLRSKLNHLPFKVNPSFASNLLRQKAVERFYVHHISSDHLTTHELSMLATYAAFNEHLIKEQLR